MVVAVATKKKLDLFIFDEISMIVWLLDILVVGRSWLQRHQKKMMALS